VATRDILGEEAFHRMISHERRRTERSHKPFLLMLLDMGDVMSADNGTISLRKILSVLPLVTRETDVVGWYKNDLVVGAMLTEIDLEEKKHIQNTMLARVSSALKIALSVQSAQHLLPLVPGMQQVLSRRPMHRCSSRPRNGMSSENCSAS
jgi:hypothetical protein